MKIKKKKKKKKIQKKEIIKKVFSRLRIEPGLPASRAHTLPLRHVNPI